MASEENDTVMDQDLDEDDESSQTQDDDEDLENDDVVAAEEEEEYEEDDLNSVSPSTSSPFVAVPLAVPSSSAVTIALPNGVDPPSSATPSLFTNPNQRSLSQTKAATIVPQDDRKPQQIDKSRQLFQRLWTDEDEIELLQGFLDYTMQRGGHNHLDTGPFYDQIKSKLQLDFNKNQLVEKLRRLKKKYRNIIEKINSGKDFSFKSPHDQATFEISRKIWSSTGKIIDNFEDDEGNPNVNASFNLNLNDSEVKSTPKSRKRPRSRPLVMSAGGGARVDEMRDDIIGNHENINNNSSNYCNVANSSNMNVSSVIEETVRSCLSPLFKELLSNAKVSVGGFNGGGIAGLAMNAIPLGFAGGEMMMDEKWRKQQIMELEVYSKRLELVQDQIKSQLEELRSMGR